MNHKSSVSPRTAYQEILDRLGIAASVLCAIHCAAMPFAVSILPLLGLGLLLDERVEWFLILSSILIALLSLLTSYIKHHKSLKPLGIFSLGLSLILTTRLFFEEAPFEVVGVVVGAFFVTAAHLKNWHLCKDCINCA